MHNVVRIMSTISLLVGVSLVGISLGTREAPESAASAQEDRVQGYRPTVARIIDEALRTPRGYENLRELTTVAPKSLSGSPAAAAAVEWAHQVFQKSGFDKVWLEPLMVPHWERWEVGQVKIVEPASHMEELPMLALGGSVGTPPQGLTAEIVEIRSFEELVERKEEVRGKIVFYNTPLDVTIRNTFDAYSTGVKYRTQGAVKAARAGAIGSLVRSVTTELDDVPHTGGCHYLEGTPRIPHAAISSVAAEKLSALLATGTEVKVHFRKTVVGMRTSPPSMS